jgi:hypothetical protein
MTKPVLGFGVSLATVALLLTQSLVLSWLTLLVPGAVTGVLIAQDWSLRFRIAFAAVAGATLSAGFAAVNRDGRETPAGVDWLVISTFYALASLASVAIAFGTVRALQHRGGE